MFRRGSKSAFIPDDEITTITNELMKGAEKDLVIVTPWIGAGHHGFDRLLDCIHDGVSVKLFCRPPFEKEPSHFAAVERLQNLGAKTLFDPVLHAKMIVVDSSALLVSSANLVQTSQVRNHEAGIVTEEKEIVEYALEYLDGLEKRIEAEPKQYCKSCANEIDPTKPYCLNCWNAEKRPQLDWKRREC